MEDAKAIGLKRSDFEIMAPAGSRESLHAAIAAGADSVYFGVEGLNMRSRSSANFNLSDLREIAALCNEHGVKSYLTLNTVVFDSDLDAVAATLDAVAESGVSAVIAADPAVIAMARERGVEVHISTQCNVTNIMAVKHYARWADVMVLARELDMDKVQAIHEAIVRDDVRGPGGEPVKIEMFCHGALCLAMSGKCYLSMHLMNSSANRGACTQICRRGYTVTDKETGDSLDVENQYIMSPKDLCTIGFLDRMIDAGVRVFKIEGRARGPEYVATAVACYREALDSVLNGTFGQEKVDRWKGRLEKIFNRGFWDGYYLGRRMGEWSGKYGSSATRVKKYCAKAVRYYPRLGVGEFLMESGALKPSDEVVETGPTTGALIFKVEELRLDRDPEPEVVKGQLFSLPVPERVRPGDRLYLWAPTDQIHK